MFVDNISELATESSVKDGMLKLVRVKGCKVNDKKDLDDDIKDRESVLWLFT